MCSLFCYCLHKVCSLDSAAPMLAMHSLFCCFLHKVCSLDSTALTLAMCSLFCYCLRNVCLLDSAAFTLALYSLSYCCLCKVSLLVSAALTLAMCSLLCCCLCKVCSLDSAALLHAFCNLSLTFLTDFTVFDKPTLNCFIALASKVCSICRLARNTCCQDLHTLSLIGTTASHCEQTLLGGMTNGTHGKSPSLQQHTGRNGRFSPHHMVNTVMHMRAFHRKMADCTYGNTTEGVLDLSNGAVSEKTSQNI